MASSFVAIPYASGGPLPVLATVPISSTLAQSTSPNSIASSRSASSAPLLVVGDNDGTLSLIDPSHSSKTIWTTSLHKPIKAITVQASPDVRILVACGSEIRSVSETGITISTFETNLIEPVRFLYYHYSSLHVAGEHVYNRYVNGKDTDYYQSGDKINAMACFDVRDISPEIFIALACQDKMIRILEGSHIIHQIPAASTPTCLVYVPNLYDGLAAGGIIIYGTISGTLVCLHITRKSVTELWTMSTSPSIPATDKTRALSSAASTSLAASLTPIRPAITSLSYFDVTGFGSEMQVKDLLVGREDGIVQIWAPYATDAKGASFLNWDNVTINQNTTTKQPISTAKLSANAGANPLTLVMAKDVKESVSYIVGRNGMRHDIPLSQQSSPEILVGTFSGKVMGLLAWVGQPPADNTIFRGKRNSLSQEGLYPQPTQFKSTSSLSSPLGPLPPLSKVGGIGRNLVMPTVDPSQNSNALKQLVEKMQNEVTELESKGPRRKEKKGAKKKAQSRDSNLQAISSSSLSMSNTVISSSDDLFVKASLSLDSDQGWYNYIIESSQPLDTICFNANFPLEIVDPMIISSTAADSAAAPSLVGLQSMKPKGKLKVENYHDDEAGSALTATYSCFVEAKSSPLTRVVLRLVPTEGKHGTFTSFVVTLTNPPQCEMLEHTIKPFSLHERVASLLPENRCSNRLKITGELSLPEFHYYLSTCFPDIPEYTPALVDASQEIKYFFKRKGTNTAIICRLTHGAAHFSSDTITAISIIKDSFIQTAQLRRQTIDVSFSIDFDTISKSLQPLWGFVDQYCQTCKEALLVEGMKEVLATVDTTGNDFGIDVGKTDSVWEDEFAALFNKGDEVLRERERMTERIDSVFKQLTDLYIEFQLHQGYDVRPKVPRLMQMLKDGTTAVRTSGITPPDFANIKKMFFQT
ncbi:Bardet-Biedl syndrome 7 protein [Chytridiales sp. JEL 0842]|nr:Bardet-Biedl syndrome 7 protein [Chytridiales sp. JEL 0842]